MIYWWYWQWGAFLTHIVLVASGDWKFLDERGATFRVYLLGMGIVLLTWPFWLLRAVGAGCNWLLMKALKTL